MMDASSIGIITSDASRDMACSQREVQYRAGSPQVGTYIHTPLDPQDEHTSSYSTCRRTLLEPTL